MEERCANCKYLKDLWYWDNYPNNKRTGKCCSALSNDGVIMQLYDADSSESRCEIFQGTIHWHSDKKSHSI